MSSIQSYIAYLGKLARDAVASGTYLYPIRGISYFIGHPSLYPPLASRILPCTLLTLGVTIPMFLFTYIPQAAILTFVNGPLGPISAIALVLSESTTVVTMLAKAFLLQGALTELFDATLVSEGQEQLVAQGRELKAKGNGREGVHRLGREVMKPLNRFSPAQFIQYLAFLPLNLIPVVGTVAFLIAQGRKSGPGFHTRYYQLKKVDGAQKDQQIQERKGGYIAFGTAAMALNLIPFASIFFTFTSTVGAALWAVDIEKRGDKHPKN
ncbi:hypothetical protein M422DRAFT_173650 [Sphaerobolus stellatus SS14]|uniref:Outer spore wall protein RRT8 n=1 Tax=Sphaerobolus stellatus (strain SS14) TaxID=990650 RepID=A0A0C9VR41_SPHS4|nr:hypothetical protein M422DRAFT_173760 [Sphaerobolus stellatus SS14]KIJ40389.1 hypothetical protein M422DRAFT_173650 [Sphaerobolus stellatus SS14]